MILHFDDQWETPTVGQLGNRSGPIYLLLYERKWDAEEILDLGGSPVCHHLLLRGFLVGFLLHSSLSV